MLTSATLPRKWLAQMDAAAAKNGLVVQYCMLWPRMALQSLEFDSVTTARGSTDYKAGGNDQWIMGLYERLYIVVTRNERGREREREREREQGGYCWVHRPMRVRAPHQCPLSKSRSYLTG